MPPLEPVDERLQQAMKLVLLALLPKDGTPRTVLWLAEASDLSPAKVTNVLFPSWFQKEHGLQYDITTDSYFIERGQA